MISQSNNVLVVPLSSSGQDKPTIIQKYQDLSRFNFWPGFELQSLDFVAYHATTGFISLSSHPRGHIEVNNCADGTCIRQSAKFHRNASSRLSR